MKQTQRKSWANNDEAKFTVKIRRRMTLCGVVFMSLADVKRPGRRKNVARLQVFL
jgi:hypothetical protein